MSEGVLEVFLQLPIPAFVSLHDKHGGAVNFVGTNLECILLVVVKVAILGTWVICLMHNLKDGGIMQFSIIGCGDIHQIVKLSEVVVIGEVALLKAVQAELGIIKHQQKKLLVLKLMDNCLDED